MSAMHQDVSLLRRLYTGESVQQARREIDSLEPDTPPIPAATSPAQQHFEARVLLGLLEFRNVYTRYPLGVTTVCPEPDGVALRVESEERATEILLNLLPTYVSDHEVHGVPGLRITQRDRTAIELRVLGEPTRLRLTGLPARLWGNAIARMLDKWIDPDVKLLCWKSSPTSSRRCSTVVPGSEAGCCAEPPFCTPCPTRSSLTATAALPTWHGSSCDPPTCADRGPGHTKSSPPSQIRRSVCLCTSRGSAVTPTKPTAATSSSFWVMWARRPSSISGPQQRVPTPACSRNSGRRSCAGYPTPASRAVCL